MSPYGVGYRFHCHVVSPFSPGPCQHTIPNLSLHTSSMGTSLFHARAPNQKRIGWFDLFVWELMSEFPFFFHDTSTACLRRRWVQATWCRKIIGWYKQNGRDGKLAGLFAARGRPRGDQNSSHIGVTRLFFSPLPRTIHDVWVSAGRFPFLQPRAGTPHGSPEPG